LSGCQKLPRGFTLLEVLLAMTVFAMSFGLILQILGNSSRTVRVAGDIGLAALHAQNVLDQVGVSEPIKEGRTNRAIDKIYRYSMDVRKIVPDDSVVPETAARLYEITMEISWGTGAQARTETFITQRVEFPPGQRY
jgi:general secretion pathway protein I